MLKLFARRTARVALALATAGVATVTVAAAAQAAAPASGADVSLTVGGTSVTTGAAKPFIARLANHGPQTATGVTVTVDASHLNTSVVDIELPGPADGCQRTATTATCPIEDIWPGGTDDSTAVIFLRARSNHGSAGSFSVTVHSASTDPKSSNNTAVVPVSATTSGYDLVAGAYDLYGGDGGYLKPGEDTALFWFLYNGGDRAAKGIAYTIQLPSFTHFTVQDRNCVYTDANTVATCSAPDAVVQPGDVFFAIEGALVTVDRDAPGPRAFTDGFVTGYGIADAPAHAAAATAGAAGLTVAPASSQQQQAAEADSTDNTADFSVFIATNRSGLAVTAPAVSAHRGDRVSVPVDVANAGPATAFAMTVDFTAPTGTRIVGTPAGCDPVQGGRKVHCVPGNLHAGKSTRLTFTLQVDAATAGTDGTVTAAGLNDDTKPADNTAAVRVTVLATGTPTTQPTSPTASPSTSTSPSATRSPSGTATRSPSGTATRSPSGTATTSPSGTATTSPSATATTSASATVTPDATRSVTASASATHGGDTPAATSASPSHGGSLPLTGSSGLAFVMLAGVGLFLVGVALLIAAQVGRRRAGA